MLHPDIYLQLGTVDRTKKSKKGGGEEDEKCVHAQTMMQARVKSNLFLSITFQSKRPKKWKLVIALCSHGDIRYAVINYPHFVIGSSFVCKNQAIILLNFWHILTYM